jgi:phospholipid-binding lipoprotein MlaA
MHFLKKIVIVTLVLSLSACAAANSKRVPDPVSDPLEPINRKIFWFNDKADVYILEPIAQAYHDVLPDPVEHSVSNFFSNLRSPVRFVSQLIQLKFVDAAEVAGRFVVNTTLGGLGLFDPATDMGLEKNEDDIGIALGYHGVPEGPYLVIPFLGPSNLRDAVGRVGNFFLDPLVIAESVGEDSSGKDAVLLSLYGLDIVQTRASLLEAIKTGKESSLDYYLFAQGAYHQYRLGLIYDGNVPEEEIDFGDDASETPEVDTKTELPAGLP